MDMLLTRVYVGPEGAFGTLSPLGKPPFVLTLERTYPAAGDSWKTKVPPGTYSCVRGMHQLKNGPQFSTFEITGVSGHSDILFHTGNTELDSEGCVLLGLTFGVIAGERGVLQSRSAFVLFLSRHANLKEFMLTVKGG